MSGTRMEPAASTGTHIDDLTEDCLIHVLSLVGDASLPIPRPNYRELRVSHPLQCSLVCTRWRTCARAASRSVTLSTPCLEKFFAEEASHFTGLKYLHLSGEYLARHPPVLSQIARSTPGLEHLYIGCSESRSLCDLASAFETWTQLKSLGISGRWDESRIMEAHEMLPVVLPRLTALEVLSLENRGTGRGMTYEGLEHCISRLKDLTLCCSTPPPPLLATVASLSLVLCWLPPHVLKFRNIVKLHLKYFEDEELPEELGKMDSLEVLRIESAQWLPRLPSFICNLKSLRLLHLESCRRLKELPANLGELSSVQKLILKNMPFLEGLPDGIGGMDSLEELVVTKHTEYGRWGTDFSALPESLGDLEKLTRLELEHRALPASIGRLRSLKELVLDDVQMEELPDSIGQLRSLEALDLDSCRIICLPETLGQLSSLTSLKLAQCNEIVHLPRGLGDLGSLCVLHISNCAKLSELPREAGRLRGLRELEIEWCGMFRDEAHVICGMEGLRFLRLTRCSRQRSLPEGLERLTSLQLAKCSANMIEQSRRDGQYPECLDGIMEAVF